MDGLWVNEGGGRPREAAHPGELVFECAGNAARREQSRVVP